MNIQLKRLLVLSLLTVSSITGAQAKQQTEQVTNYPDGITMVQSKNNSDFLISVSDGTTFRFDSGSQTVLFTKADGEVKVIDFNKQP